MTRTVPLIAALVYLSAAAVPPAAMAQPESAVYLESFDSTPPPALPAGWTTTGDGWSTSDASGSSGSGANNLAHIGSAAGDVVTGPIDLTGLTTATLRFLARRTSTYPLDALTISASTDGGITFDVTVLPAGNALPTQTSSWQPVQAAVPAELLGVSPVLLRLEGMGGTSSSSSARIDDLTITSPLALDVDPDQLSLSAPMGASDEATFTATNHSGGALEIAAPIVTGDAFSVSPSTSLSLADGASQTYSVGFTPTTTGEHEGSVSLDYGSGQVGVLLYGTTPTGTFGFGSPTSSVAAEDTLEVPLHLNFQSATPLQGLQFEVDWSEDGLAEVELRRGSAVQDEALWTLSAERDGNVLKVLLLAEGTGGLAAGLYEPLLTLRVVADSVSAATEVVLRLTGLVGALAASTGDDAALQLQEDLHTATVAPGQANFHVEPPALDAGLVPVGTMSTAVVTISNPGGSSDLHIQDAFSTNALWTVSPAIAVIPPDSQQVFTFTFSPTLTAFGRQSGTVIFTHDGTGGPAAEVPVVGIGTGGRGDGGADGSVDAADVVLEIDLVLGREVTTPAHLESFDLYPFPHGDEALDVRDLTVLAHAIVNGRWPDDVVLPEDLGIASKTGGAEGDVVVDYEMTEGGIMFFVEHDVPLRALQLVLHLAEASTAPVVHPSALPAATVLTGYDVKQRDLRLLLYRADGGAQPPGRYALVRMPVEGLGTSMETAFATAIGADGSRHTVRLDVPHAVGVATADELPDQLQMETPYPNPLDASGQVRLHVPVALPGAGPLRVRVFDMLGRHVATPYDAPCSRGRTIVSWDLRDAFGRTMSPGVYLISAEADGRVDWRTVVVR